MKRRSDDRAFYPRLASILLVFVQCATLALLETGNSFGVIAGGLALLSLWEPLRISPRQAPHWLWYALLGLLLAIKHQISPEELPEQITFFNTVVGYEAARFLIFVQVTQLFIQRPAGRLPTWTAGIACLSMVLASNVRLSPATQSLSQGLCLAFAAALALFAHSNRVAATGGGRRLAHTLLAGVLLAAAAGGIGTARLLQRFEDDLERLLAEPTGPITRDVSRGFSGRGAIGDISSWKSQTADQVALRIYGASAPGYLRGMVFESLQNAYWTTSTESRPVGVISSSWIQPLRPHDDLFELTPTVGESRPVDSLDVWPDSLSGRRLFAPLNAAWLATSPCTIGMNTHDLPTRIDRESTDPFTMFLAAASPPVQLSEEARGRYLEVDEDLQLSLQFMANDLFAQRRTAAEKIETVVQFFQQNFEYALLPQMHRGTYVVSNFIRSRSAGHCELFASSGAILLRLGGVPTRYVTGYVVTERNDVGGYWVARGRDAHAWIEAYDAQQQRWVNVECTPPSGVPQAIPADEWSDWMDSKQQQAREWFHGLTVGGIQQILVALASVPGLTVVLGSVVALLMWKHRTAVRPASRPRPIIDYPELARTLRRGDRLARKCGYERDDGETLSAFAERMRISAPAVATSSMLADWYDEYIRVRYARPLAEGRSAELAEQLSTVAAALRTR